jgi:hypothetical protein
LKSPSDLILSFQPSNKHGLFHEDNQDKDLAADFMRKSLQDLTKHACSRDIILKSPVKHIPFLVDAHVVFLQSLKGELRCHRLLNTEMFFQIFEIDFPTLFQVNKPLSNCLHKFPLLLSSFEVTKSWYNSNARTVRFGGLFYYLA